MFPPSFSLILYLQDVDEEVQSDRGSESGEEGEEAASSPSSPSPLLSLPSKVHLTQASPRTPDGTPRTPPHSSRTSAPTTRRSMLFCFLFFCYLFLLFVFLIIYLKKIGDHSVYELLQDINYDQIIAARDEFNDGGLSLKEVFCKKQNSTKRKHESKNSAFIFPTFCLFIYLLK